jgi:hypothetical protein
MAGETATPELNYHKETKLLIAYGEPSKLKTIDDVLKTLPPSNLTPPAAIEHWKLIKDLQNQVNELRGKVDTLNASTNISPADKSGK